MSLNLPEIKFHMLWAKGNFLFQGVRATALVLQLRSAPAPAPGCLYCCSPAKGAMKTKPTQPIRLPLRYTWAYISGSLCCKQTVTLLLPKPQLFKEWLWQGQTSDLATDPTTPGLWPRCPELHSASTARAGPGHTQCGHRFVPGTL